MGFREIRYGDQCPFSPCCSWMYAGEQMVGRSYVFKQDMVSITIYDCDNWYSVTFTGTLFPMSLSTLLTNWKPWLWKSLPTIYLFPVTCGLSGLLISFPITNHFLLLVTRNLFHAQALTLMRLFAKPLKKSRALQARLTSPVLFRNQFSLA